MLLATQISFLLGASFAWAVPLRLGDRSASGIVGRACGTHITEEDKIMTRRAIDTANIARELKDPLEPMTFDVYWNVISANNTLEGGWIPDSQIEAQMKVLNEDYNTTGVSWRFVNTTRIMSADWFQNVAHTEKERVMKGLFRKGNARALNIYTIGFNSTTKTLGYTSLPKDYAKKPWKDGIVLRYSTLPGGSLAHYNGGRTLTHESGHWLGLYHTFEKGCKGKGDEVDDTTPESSAAAGCPIGRNTCHGPDPDPIHNFMDYTYDTCMSEFTPGQARRMHETVRTFRPQN